MNSNMTPIDWAKRPLQKYADFSGRAPRAEYWWFYLLFLITMIIAIILDSLLGTRLEGGLPGWITAIVDLAFLLPMLAASVRRLHDTNKSAWWLLIIVIPLIGGIWMLVLMATRGDSGPNRFGPNPYGEGDAATA